MEADGAMEDCEEDDLGPRQGTPIRSDVTSMMSWGIMLEIALNSEIEEGYYSDGQ